MSEQEGSVSNASDHWQREISNTITEFPGTHHATVHCTIACAFAADVIEQSLKLISETLQKAGALEVSFAVSVSPAGFSPIGAARLSASWMEPLSGADE